MRIRLMTSDGSKTVAIPDRDLTVGALKARISAATSIPLHAVCIKVGYPPRILDVCDNTLVSDTPVADGSVLTIVRGSSSHAEPSTASTASTAEHRMPTPPPPHLPATAAHVRRHHTPHNAADGDDGDGSVPVGEGHVVRRVVPSDNNCLFHALGSCLGDKAATPEWMRGVVCDAILRYPQTYTEAVLGMPVAEYCEWIGKSTSWGGGIELAIFSSELRLEICSIDIQTGRADRFGEGKHARRVILFYSGVHYDYAAFTYDRASPQDFDLTVFDTDESGDEKLAAACELADKMRQKHEFTDTANFALRCNDCSMLLRGEKEAQQHLLDTLHVNYSEV